MEDHRKSQGPGRVLRRGHERGLQLAVKSLHHTIGLGMVAGSPMAADTEESHDLAPHVGLELTATVRGEAQRDAEPGDPSSDEGLGDSVRGGVSDGGSLGPACEAIDAGEDVAMASRGRQGPDQVNVDMVEA